MLKQIEQFILLFKFIFSTLSLLLIVTSGRMKVLLHGILIQRNIYWSKIILQLS